MSVKDPTQFSREDLDNTIEVILFAFGMEKG
jgi:hypothetical protein